jgi:hypothetical protein
MRTKVEFLSFEDVLNVLPSLHFDVREVPGVANQGIANQGIANQGVANQGVESRVLVQKYGAGAILARSTPPNRSPSSLSRKDRTHPAAWVERPGLLVGGEVATLLDRGYQKFWKTARVEVPATADSLKAVHRFAEELREVIGEPSLYNESLGTTSGVYLYDRVQARDLPPAERPKRAWDLASGKTPLLDPVPDKE